MSQCVYHEAHPPSGVTHSASAYFTHVAKSPNKTQPEPPNLILVKSTVLEVYDLRRAAGASHLELRASFPLYGVVEDLAVLRSKSLSSQRDAIIITFRDAKVCVLDWDSAQHTVQNTSLHYYEGDASLRNGHTTFPYPPRVVTDPQGRCAAVCMFDHQLALLPAMGGDALDGEEGAGGAEGAAGTEGFGASTTVGNSTVLDLSKMGIREVRDLVFLHGYTEPVLLILHQELPTWAGRYRDRKDTCALTALSISLHRQRYPIIWSFNNLPSDSFQTVAVPKGGVLVLSQNLLLYYTQGFSSGLAVNRFAHAGELPPRIDFKVSTEPLATIVSQHARMYGGQVHPECAPAAGKSAPRAPGLEVELSGAHCVWLQPDVCLLGLRTGQLIQLQLHFMANVVSRLQAQFLMMAPYCSCLTKLTNDLLFLASWTGDSMLVRYEKEGSANDADQDDSSQPWKRRRLDSGQLDFEFDDNEMRFFFHSRSQSKVKPEDVRYTLEVVDSLSGVAPVHDIIALDPSAYPPPDQVNAPSKVVARLVGCVGTGRTGALAVTGISFQPEVLERAPLDGIQGLWAVHWTDKEAEGGEKAIHPYHTYLLITAADGTCIMQSGEELDEITDSVEYSTEPTIAAGSLLGGALVCQVIRHSVLLMNGTVKVCQLDLEAALQDTVGEGSGVEIVQAAMCGAYVLLLLSSRQVLLLRVSGEGADMKLEVLHEAVQELLDRPQAFGQDRISACTLYQDTTAWLATATALPTEEEEEEEATTFHVPGLGPTPAPSRPKPPPVIKPAAPNTMYCVVCRESGQYEVYTLPDMQLMFCHAALCAGLRVLQHNGSVPSMAQQKGEERAEGERELPTVVQLRLEAFDDLQDHGSLSAPGPAPFLFALTSEGILLVYRAFQPQLGSVAFCRQNLKWPGPGMPENEEINKRRKLVSFDHLGSPPYLFQGLFLTGDQPTWLVVSRSCVFPHPMPMDSPITCFTPFHNINCPMGFVVGTEKGFMEICAPPADTQLGQHWPVRKISLRASPHRISQHPKTGSLMLLVSKLLPYEPRDPPEIGGDQHAAAAYVAADEAARAAGREEVAELRIMNPNTFELQTAELLHRNEVGLSVKALTLRNTKTEAQQLMVAVGTGLVMGEDYPCSGRIIFYDLIVEDGPPTEGGEQDGNQAAPPTYKLQELYTKEFPGPLTVAGEFHGYLMVATGHRLELHSWNGTNLVKAAFFDGPMLISSINTVKDYLLVGDVHNSVSFLRFKETGRQLELLGKDFDRIDVAATEFLFNAGKLSFVVADSVGTIRVLAFDQDDPYSWKGKKLLLRGAFHTGHVAPRLIRMRMAVQDKKNRQATFFGSTAGSFGFLIPVWDATMFERLATLQKLLVHGVPHVAGLNPRAFRNRHVKIPKGLGGGESFMHPQDTGCILDGDLVLEFLQLDVLQQKRLAKQVETTHAQLVGDMIALTEALAIC